MEKETVTPEVETTAVDSSVLDWDSAEGAPLEEVVEEKVEEDEGEDTEGTPDETSDTAPEDTPDDDDDEEDDATDAEETQGEEDDTDESEDEDVPAASKTYKGKLVDGSAVDVPDNMVFKLKENGRFRKVTFKDLKDNHAGQVAWDEKFKEFSEKEAALEREVGRLKNDKSTIDSYVADMMKDAERADIGGAITKLAEITGQEPAGFIQTWMDAFASFYDDLSGMSDVERNNQFLLMQNKALDSRLTRKKDAEQLTTAQTRISVKLKELRGQHDYSEADQAEAFEELKILSNGNAVNITPENIANAVLSIRAVKNIIAAAKEQGVKLEQKSINRLHDFVRAGERNGEEYEFSDFIDAVKEESGRSGVVSGQAAKNLNRKVRKNRKTTPKKVKKGQTGADFEKGQTVDSLWETLGSEL